VFTSVTKQQADESELMCWATHQLMGRGGASAPMRKLFVPQKPSPPDPIDAVNRRSHNLDPDQVQTSNDTSKIAQDHMAPLAPSLPCCLHDATPTPNHMTIKTPN